MVRVALQTWPAVSQTSTEPTLIAGGSGAGFSLPLVESLIQSSAAMNVVLVARHLESVSWFVDTFELILGAKTETL